jgi:hypothetical protein
MPSFFPSSPLHWPQIDHIHVVKTSELKAAQQGGGGMRMSGSIVGGSISPVPSLSQCVLLLSH